MRQKWVIGWLGVLASVCTASGESSTWIVAVNPGEEGLRIALKVDGSLEIFREGDRKHVVDERLVTTRELKIKGGKIVLPGDPGW